MQKVNILNIDLNMCNRKKNNVNIVLKSILIIKCSDKNAHNVLLVMLLLLKDSLLHCSIAVFTVFTL